MGACPGWAGDFSSFFLRYISYSLYSIPGIALSVLHTLNHLALPSTLLVQFSSVAQSCLTLWLTPWTAARLASLSITNSRSLLKLMSIESAMPSNCLILCRPLLLPSIFPSIRVFPVSQFFTSGGQSIGVSASASALPMNIRDWFPLGWTGLISLQFKGLSRVFSSTTVQNHQFFGTQPSFWSSSHICTWLLEKQIALTNMDLCQQSNVCFLICWLGLS